MHCRADDGNVCRTLNILDKLSQGCPFWAVVRNRLLA